MDPEGHPNVAGTFAQRCGAAGGPRHDGCEHRPGLDHANERCDDSPAVGGGPFVDTHDGPLSFDAFFGESYSRLARALYLLVHDRAEAEDLAQEAFARVYERWDQVGAMESPTGYLFRVGLNLHRKRLRRLAVAAKHVVRGDDHVPDPAEAIADHRGVLDGLATLPDGQRAAVVLVDFLGLDSAEAGEVLGIEAVSVRARVHRARAALRTCWRRRCLKTCGRPSSCRIGHAGRPTGAGVHDAAGAATGDHAADHLGDLAVAVMIGGGALVWQLRPEGASRIGRGRQSPRRRPSVHKHLRAGRRVRTVSSATRWPTPTGGSRRSRGLARRPDRTRARDGVPLLRSKPFSVRLSEASDPADRDGIDHRADRVVAVHVTPDPDDSFETDVRRIRGGVRWTILDEDALTIGGRPAVGFVYRSARRGISTSSISESAARWRSRSPGGHRTTPAWPRVPTGVRGRADDARDAHRALRTDHSASEGLRPVDVDHRWA